MNSRTRHFWCFSVPFVLVLVTLIITRPSFVNLNPGSQKTTPALPAHSTSSLLGNTLPVSDLVEAQSRAPITELGLTVPDTAVVVLLGGMGCSADQVELLRYWSEQPAATGNQAYPVLALYADPLLGTDQGAYESLLLRRVSQAKIPFLVSEDPDFNLRAMGIRTPQVVLAESQVITHVFSSTTDLIFPVLQ